ncbi:Fibronectin type III [uncultured Caudovirales phage]|uniref:Fibronectin type III n=1 Tax=uncultured Caudovirales phage TaxID=2100421 RepID=A0A6J5N2L5_9CAUD|nr:Fibronectin type III [uncultured Caudovirales phage]
MATYTIGTAGTSGYYNNRGANLAPYNYGTKITVPNGKCWLVTDVTIQLASNSGTKNVYGHIWNAAGTDYWQGSAVSVAADTSPTFTAYNLGDPGSTKLLNNISGANDYWYVGFSKAAADSINWDVTGATGVSTGTATGDTVNGDLDNFTPTASLARCLVGKFTYTEVTAPAAPTLTATPGNGQVSLSWTAPSNGGVAISGYTLKRGTTALYTGTNTSFTETGLSNGTSYTYTVTATNGVGTGSAGSASATPRTVPSAPTVSITRGSGSVEVTWSAGSNGGSSINATYYAINEGSATAAPASPFTLSGLTNGTPVTITMYHTNAAGTGATGTSNTVTPYGIPFAPTITSITPTANSLSVAFTAGSNNGSTITNYKYSLNGGSTFTARSPAAITSPLEITGLTSNTPYEVQIRAVNAAGDGTPTATTSATTLGGRVSISDGAGNWNPVQIAQYTGTIWDSNSVLVYISNGDDTWHLANG